MKSTLAILAVTATATAFSLPAAAQLNMSSVYIGGSLGRADQKVPDEKDTAWKLFGGYQFNRNFAAELGYHHLGEVSRGGVTTEARAWDLVGLGILPVANTLSAYGKLGLYYGQTERRTTGVNAKENDNGLTYGVGVQWDAIPALGVRLDWQRYDQMGGPTTGEGDVDVLSVGVLYRFR